MNDLETIDIDADTKIFIFSIEKNSFMVDNSIIPMEQIKKIKKFKNTKDRTKRLLARTFLFNYCKKNYILEDFTFAYTNNQRPRFKGTHKIDFSISYSKDMVAIAISTMGIVGLDIEYMDDSIVSKSVALEFMNGAEFSTFVNIKKEHIINYFYEKWTAKESFLKASGDGLRVNPKTVTNSLGKTIYFQDYVINIFRLLPS
ncbi:MAG: hypothetical protein DRG30_02445 [Epsilonproteobacteria bacterium]|nr:MAG: hypothetical protein DRG30_02445 [Campylobacterota bacterium]